MFNVYDTISLPRQEQDICMYVCKPYFKKLMQTSYHPLIQKQYNKRSKIFKCSKENKSKQKFLYRQGNYLTPGFKRFNHISILDVLCVVGLTSGRFYKIVVVGNNWLVGNKDFSETALRIFLIFALSQGTIKVEK